MKSLNVWSMIKHLWAFLPDYFADVFKKYDKVFLLLKYWVDIECKSHLAVLLQQDTCFIHSNQASIPVKKNGYQILSYTLRFPRYSGFSFLNSNSIFYLQWALLSHSVIRNYLIRICDYIRYILYSNSLDLFILIVVFTVLPLQFFERESVQLCFQTLD